MAENTEIAWADHTFNPWMGCTKVAPGCKHCYAETLMDTRWGKVAWGPNGTRAKTSPSNWLQPVKWNGQAGRAGVRRRVFCASLADVFEDWDGPILDHHGLTQYQCVNCNTYETGEYRMYCEMCGTFAMPVTMDDLRRDLFELIDRTPHLDWLLLTKRPENVRRMWPATKGEVAGLVSPMWPGVKSRPNVYLGTSFSDQPTAGTAIPELLKLRDLSPVLFVSAEPLLGAIDLSGCMDPLSMGWVENNPTGPEGGSALDWVITGGESGPHARPCNVQWIRDIVGQCRDAGVACFVKQLGSKPEEWDASRRQPGFGPHIGNTMQHPKGGNPSEWAEDLRVQEFPNVEVTA